MVSQIEYHNYAPVKGGAAVALRPKALDGGITIHFFAFSYRFAFYHRIQQALNETTKCFFIDAQNCSNGLRAYNVESTGAA